MLAAEISPLYLFFGHVFSMNAFDLLFWSVATWLLVRLFTDGSPRLWPSSAQSRPASNKISVSGSASAS
jgi:hypothetical protein